MNTKQNAKLSPETITQLRNAWWTATVASNEAMVLAAQNPTQENVDAAKLAAEAARMAFIECSRAGAGL